MEYILSIRISFPQSITKVLKREKNRFIAKYGSAYKSEPHITLYLGRYTKRGFLKLIRDLQSLSIKQFIISLLEPKITREKALHRKLFFVDVSNRKELYALHAAILKTAVRYRSSLLRKKEQERLRKGLYGKVERNNLKRYGYAQALQLFKPHITLGEVDIDAAQPTLANVKNNLRSLRGTKFSVLGFTALLHEKRSSKKDAKLIKEVRIKLL